MLATFARYTYIIVYKLFLDGEINYFSIGVFFRLHSTFLFQTTSQAEDSSRIDLSAIQMRALSREIPSRTDGWIAKFK